MGCLSSYGGAKVYNYPFQPNTISLDKLMITGTPGL